ncbi:MAG: AN1-type zinc finger domain-containing protein [Candidatus Bathyarchaeia archaeon]
MKCQQCNVETYMPFRCPYCNGYFCAEHRLPENHNCPEQWKAKTPQPPSPVFTQRENQDAYEHTVTFQPMLPVGKTKLVTFSKTELQHLLIGTALVLAVGLSIMLEFNSQISTALILAALFTASFLLHELAHKIAAQHYRLWAEFRLTLWGAVITLISIISPLFKIISPGAVMIAGGFVDRKIMGKTAIAGPLTNITLAAILGIIAFLTLDPLIFSITTYTAFINAFLAVFNLIPFGIMDGFKVFGWNKLVWALAFSVSIGLMFFTILFV